MRRETLRDRMMEARRRAFVGRDAELELFAQALDADAPPFSVLFVHGPGGIGKSTLLDRLADEARARACPVLRVDARSVAPTAESLLGAIGVASLDAIPAPCALLVDTYEELGALDAWVRESLVPALPARSLLVLAGRDPPHAAWRTDAGLASVLRVRSLRNLGPDESARLLEARGVPDERRAHAHALTHGHPLALALVAELSKEEALPALTPDVVRVLLERMVRTIDDPSLREALEIAALARVVTEPLLAELGIASPAAAFAWLRSLSFVAQSAEGLAMHDLARDAILADLSFRDPQRSATLQRSISARNHRVTVSSTGRVRERAFLDEIYMMRHRPGMRAYYDWQLGRAGGARPMREDELGALVAEIAQHEGDRAARIARAWWDRQPGAFVALLDSDGRYLGALLHLRFESIDEDAIAIDPALAKIAEIVVPREGEHVRVLRFWIWRDRYQELGAAAHGPHSMVVGMDWSFTAGLAGTVLVVQRADAWRPFFEQLRFLERPEAAFSSDDRRFTVFARDFREDPWSAPAPMGEARAPAAVAPRVVLSQEDFEAAVRDALARAARPAELASSPLLRSRLLAEWAEGETPTPEMIRELLVVAASSLADPRDDRPRRCVELTYLEPAPTQEIAAERLGLAFSTYRRQLARGVERVVAYLWDREVRGAR